MNFPEIYSATGMKELIQQIGFLPLLDSGIEGFAAEDIVAEDCRYVTFPEGIHQPGMVAGLLQLQKKQIPSPR